MGSVEQVISAYSTVGGSVSVHLVYGLEEYALLPLEQLNIAFWIDLPVCAEFVAVVGVSLGAIDGVMGKLGVVQTHPKTHIVPLLRHLVHGVPPEHLAFLTRHRSQAWEARLGGPCLDGGVKPCCIRGGEEGSKAELWKRGGLVL